MLPIEVGPINPSGRGGCGLVPLHWPDMRLKLDDPSAAGDLVSFLNARPDCVAAETGRGVVEVNILGSQRLPFMRLELDLRLGAWRVANPGVGVVLVTG